MKKRRYWRPEQVEILEARYPHDEPKELMALIGGTFTVSEINKKALKLGLRKTEAYRQLSRIDAGGKFTKGCPSWNKGKSMPSTGRSRETQFKKGSRPPNWKPVGSIRESKDGHLQIKIKEGKLNWVNLHVIRWEEKHGKRPPGMAITFKDGNRRNFADDNLECVTKAEMMRRNSIQNYPEEIKEVIRLKAVITRKVNGN